MTYKMTPLWRLYAGILVPVVGAQLCSFCALVVWNVRTIQRRRSASRNGIRTVDYPVAAVIPCYLPNEECILLDTIEHVTKNLTHLDDLTIYIVYNTPYAMDIEDALHGLARDFKVKGRKLVVHKVEGSTSKARNLNDIMPLITAKFVVIYDADHRPDPPSLAIAANFLQDHEKVDCVQGSMYVRDGGGPLLRTLINAEYFTNYFVNLPMTSIAWGSAWFAGTNGVFRTKSLQKMNFDEKAMTEDVNITWRGVVQHDMLFQFLPDCSSSELAPVGWKAFVTQRMRWAMGWDEVMLKFGLGDAVSTRRARVAAFFILIWRYYMQFNIIFSICLNAGALQKPPLVIQHLNIIGFFFFLCLVASFLLHAVLHKLGVREVCGIALYMLCGPIYAFYTTINMLVSITRVVTGNQGKWNITQRSVPSGDAAQVRNSAAVPLLTEKSP